MLDDKLFLYKRSNGVYYLGRRITKNRIQWKTTKCHKKPDAIAFMKNFSFTPAVQTEDKTNITLSSLLSQYSERQKHTLRPNSLLNNEKSITAFVRMFGDRLLSLYTVADVEDFKNSFLNRGLSKETANMNFRGCKTIFNFAVKHGYLQKNVFSESKQFKVEQKRPPFVTAEDFQKLLSVVREPILKDVFLFAALTGCRLNEITNLRFSNIDLVKNQVTIESSDSFRTKSGRIRTIPMHDQIVSMMQRLQAERRPGRDFVFSKPNGFQFQNGFLSHRFKMYIRVAGLSEELHFHCLRHLCASHLVSAGVSLYVVSAILGHANVSTSAIYSGFSASSLHSSINKISI